MLEHLDAFTADYCAEFEPSDAAARADPPIRIKPDLWSLEGLRQCVEAVLRMAHVLQRANARRQSLQRAMLYEWLCTIWLDHFGGKLTYGRRATSEVSGPLVEFLLAAMRQVMPKDALPSREAVRDNIDDQRRERENAKHAAKKLKKRLGL
jgi:hypothetical protein